MPNFCSSCKHSQTGKICSGKQAVLWAGCTFIAASRCCVLRVLLILFVFTVSMFWLCGCHQTRTRTFPLSSTLISSQSHKDDTIIQAASNIDTLAPDAQVRVNTDAIRSAILIAPAADVAKLVKEYETAFAARDKAAQLEKTALQGRAEKAEKALEDEKDQELKKQAAYLRWLGFALVLLVTPLLVWAHQLTFAATSALIGLLSLGLAQLISQPWFMPACGIAAGIGLVSAGVAAYVQYRRHQLSATIASESVQLKGVLAKVVPTLDDAYDQGSELLKAQMDENIFGKLKQVLEASERATIHQIRADGVK